MLYVLKIEFNLSKINITSINWKNRAKNAAKNRYHYFLRKTNALYLNPFSWHFWWRLLRVKPSVFLRSLRRVLGSQPAKKLVRREAFWHGLATRPVGWATSPRNTGLVMWRDADVSACSHTKTLVPVGGNNPLVKLSIVTICGDTSHLKYPILVQKLQM